MNGAASSTYDRSRAPHGRWAWLILLVSALTALFLTLRATPEAAAQDAWLSLSDVPASPAAPGEERTPFEEESEGDADDDLEDERENELVVFRLPESFDAIQVSNLRNETPLLSAQIGAKSGLKRPPRA